MFIPIYSYQLFMRQRKKKEEEMKHMTVIYIYRRTRIKCRANVEQAKVESVLVFIY